MLATRRQDVGRPQNSGPVALRAQDMRRDRQSRSDSRIVVLADTAEHADDHGEGDELHHTLAPITIWAMTRAWQQALFISMMPTAWENDSHGNEKWWWSEASPVGD